MQVVLNPEYTYLNEWIDALPATFEQQGKVIYNARNQIRVIDLTDDKVNPAVSRTNAEPTLSNGGLIVNAKRYCVPRPFNRVIYSFFRAPKAERAYRNALRLQQMGIPTPTPIAYILCGRGLLRESYLVTVQSSLSRNFYEFRHHPLQGYESIVRQFARFTASVHQHGVLHLDYSPGNILFDIDAAGQAQFLLVDINRMRFCKRPIGLHAACKNFCRLWGNQDFFELLADEYATARGWDNATTRRLILHYWKQFWKHRK